MQSKLKLFFFLILNIAVAITTGCSGGGASSGSGAQPAAAKSVTGVAATGAPLANAMVFIKDSSDTPIERHQAAGSDGSFSFDASDFKPPFFLKVNAPAQNYYSVADNYGMANITPLSTIVVAQASQRDDLDALYIHLKPAEANAVAANMNAADKAIQNKFASLMNEFGATGNSLVYGSFSANGKGLDAMLDALSITVAPGSIMVNLKAVANGAPGRLLLQATASQLASAIIPTSGDFVPPVTPPQTVDGAALYTSKCAGCHGAVGISNLKGRITVALTQSAINSNRGGMSMLNGVTVAEIQSIYDAISATSSTPAPSPTPVPTPAPTPVVPDGAALYSANCAGCHGALASSSKKGISIVRLQNAISGNVGGMGSLSKLTSAEQQAVVDALNPSTPAPAPSPAPAPTPAPAPAPTPVVPNGAALYSANCAGCHGALASSSKKGITIARLQGAITASTGGMGFLSNLSVSEVQAIVTVLTPATPTPTPTPTPSPAPVADGATLYSTKCASCHGTLATSAKAGATTARIQTAIANNTGGMGFLSTLTTAEITALATALNNVTPVPTPTPSPAPVTDGATLYSTNCASCHGTLATSAKAGATTGRIQTAIANNTGGMGFLSTLSTTEINAMETALATVAPTPTPTPACGSCHAIPPATGRHSKHKSKGIGCVTCHGSGYSETSFNAATHNNGVKNIDTSVTKWNSTTRSCANSCHGNESW